MKELPSGQAVTLVEFVSTGVAGLATAGSGLESTLRTDSWHALAALYAHILQHLRVELPASLAVAKAAEQLVLESLAPVLLPGLQCVFAHGLSLLSCR